jgi:fructan beta-fructosidase
MTWGHAISRDLIRWEQLPNALEPDALGTMFSGSAVVDWQNTAGFQNGSEKALVAIYTAAGGTSPESQGQPFTQCLAFSNDRGRTWEKYSENPVLGHIAGENRDPKVIWYEPTHQWIMTLYLENNDFAFFSSPDLKHWTHLQNMTVPDTIECPDFFELSIDDDPHFKKWVWTAANGNYLIGSFDGTRFTPEIGPLRSDQGGNFFAAQTFSDIPVKDDRRVQIAWMARGEYPDMPFNQQMSFPCELRLISTHSGLRLARMPIHEIENLHHREHAWADRPLPVGDNPLAFITGELLEIRMIIELKKAAAISLDVGGESITYSVAEKTLSCLGHSASLSPKDGLISLHILVDRTSIEVFANEGLVSMSSCYLPSAEKKASARSNLVLRAVGDEAHIQSLQVFELLPAWIIP